MWGRREPGEVPGGDVPVSTPPQLMLSLAELALRRPRNLLIGIFAVTAILALGLGRLQLRTDGAALHPPANETVRQSEIDSRTFHDPEPLIVVVTSRPDGPAVESPAGFAFLAQLDEALRRLPDVRSSGVRSLAGLTDLRITAEEISADSFLGSIPDLPEEFSALVERIRQHPFTDGLLLGRDGVSAAFYVPRIETRDRRQFIENLEQFLSEQAAAPFDFYLTGPQVAETLLGDMVLSDLSRLIPVMVAVIFLLLWIMLRTPGGMLIPFLEVMLVLIWTLGTMAWAGVPMTLVTTLLPVLLMAMSIADEIHLLERFQCKLSAVCGTGQGNATESPRRSQVKGCLLEALREIEKPILATSVTTAMGLLAFLVTSITPLRHFGLFAALGILLAMVLTFTVIPAAITLLPARWFLPRPAAAGRPVLRTHEAWTVRLGGRGLLIGGTILALALPGVARLRVEDNWIDNFDPQSSIVVAEQRFNQSFWGSRSFDVVLSGPSGFFFRPQGVSLMETLVERTRAVADVEGVTSYLVPVGQVAQATGEDGPLAELSPRRLDDFVTLATMSEDPFGLLGFVTADGSQARARLFLAGEDYERDQALAETLRRLLAGLLADGDVTAHFSGDVPVGLEMVHTIVSDQLRSIGMAFIAISVLVVAVYRWSRSSLAVLLPVVAATATVFGGMGYVGLPLGVATSMFASLVLGVGVDFGFHFLHGYRRESRRAPDPRGALTATLATSGQAIRWNAVVLALGFLVLALSALRPNHSLGVLLAVALMASYVMTLLLLPGLLPVPAGRRDRAAVVAVSRAEAGG